ncbi:MAG: transcriptional regulator with XRE-family HTH domain [Flavobacteriales bacterium]|jgi:transcriptional regulator with XRE-family HTH domain
MASMIAKNIKKLRGGKNLTQSQLADKLGLNRSVIGAYEEGRAEPRMSTLITIASYFNVSLDELVLNDLAKSNGVKGFSGDAALRVLPITVDRATDKELITVVPVKAAAGYLDGYGDVDYIENLPRFSMPIQELPQDQSLRLFQIAGDSMLPLPDGAYVLGSFVDDIAAAGGGDPHIVVTRNDGIVFKRVENRVHNKGTFRMISENTVFEPYDLAIEEVVEIWKARAYILFDLPNTTVDRFKEIQSTLERIESKIN